MCRLLRLPALLLLLACSTGDSDDADTGRTDCEDACYQQEFLTCNQGCTEQCAQVDPGDDRDRCLDGCQGDCLVDYDACVAENCAD